MSLQAQMLEHPQLVAPFRGGYGTFRRWCLAGESKSLWGETLKVIASKM